MITGKILQAFSLPEKSDFFRLLSEKSPMPVVTDKGTSAHCAASRFLFNLRMLIKSMFHSNVSTMCYYNLYIQSISTMSGILHRSATFACKQLHVRRIHCIYYYTCVLFLFLFLWSKLQYHMKQKRVSLYIYIYIKRQPFQWTTTVRKRSKAESTGTFSTVRVIHDVGLRFPGVGGIILRYRGIVVANLARVAAPPAAY